MKPNILWVAVGVVCMVGLGYWLCLTRKPSRKPGPVGFAMLPANPVE